MATTSTTTTVNISPVALRARSANNARPPERDWQESFYALESRYRQTQQRLNERDDEVKMLKVALRRGYPVQHSVLTTSRSAALPHASKTRLQHKAPRASNVKSKIAAEANLPQFISEIESTLSSSSSLLETSEEQEQEEEELLLEEEETLSEEDELQKQVCRPFPFTTRSNANTSFNSPYVRNVQTASRVQGNKYNIKSNRTNVPKKDHKLDDDDDNNNNLKLESLHHHRNDILRYISPNTVHSTTETKLYDNNNKKKKQKVTPETREGNVVRSESEPTNQIATESPIQHNERQTGQQANTSAAGGVNDISPLPASLSELTSKLASNLPDPQLIWGSEVNVESYIAASALYHANEELRRHINELESSRQQAQERYAECQRELQVWQNKMEERLSELHHVVNERDVAMHKLSLCTQQIASYEQTLQTHLHESDKMRFEYDTQITSLRSKLIAGCDSNEILTRDVRKLLQENRDKTEELMALRSKFALTESALMSQRNTNENLLVELKSLNSQLQEERQRLLHASREARANAIMHDKLTTTEERVRELEEERAHLEQAHGKLLNEMLHLTDNVTHAVEEQVQARLDETHHKAEHWEHVAQLLYKDIAQREEQQTLTEHECKAVQQECEQLKQEKNELCRTLATCETKLEAVWPTHERDTKSLTPEQITLLAQNRKAYINVTHRTHYAATEKNEQVDTNGDAEDKEHHRANDTESNDEDNAIFPDFTSQAEQIEELRDANDWLSSEVKRLELNNNMLQERIEELTRQRDEEQNAMHHAALAIVANESIGQDLLMEQVERVAFLESQVENLRGYRTKLKNSTSELTNTINEQKWDSNSISNMVTDNEPGENNVIELFLGQMIAATGLPANNSNDSNTTDNSSNPFAHVFCTVDFLLYDTVTTPTVIGLNGHLDTTVTFAVKMDELLLYYLQTRELAVQLHRVRENDEIQHKLAQELMKPKAPHNIDQVVVNVKQEQEEQEEERYEEHENNKAEVTAQKTNTNANIEHLAQLDQHDNANGGSRRSTSSSGDTSKSSRNSSNDLRMAERMYETIAHGSLCLKQFIASALNESNTLPMMRGHVKLYDSENCHVASVEVQITTQKPFSEHFLHYIKNSMSTMLPTQNEKNHYKTSYMQSTNAKFTSKCTNASTETSARELLKPWLELSSVLPTFTTTNIFTRNYTQKSLKNVNEKNDSDDDDDEEEEEKKQLQMLQRLRNELSNTTSWQRLKQQKSEIALEQHQWQPRKVFKSTIAAHNNINNNNNNITPTNAPSHHGAHALHGISPYVVDTEHLSQQQEQEREDEAEVVSVTSSTGTATSDFTIHVPPPPLATSSTSELLVANTVKPSLPDTNFNINDSSSSTNKNTMPTENNIPLSTNTSNTIIPFHISHLSSHIELPLNVEINALIVDVERVELPSVQVNPENNSNTSFYPPRLSCHYSLVPLNVNTNTTTTINNNNSNSNISRINQERIKLAAPISPQQTIEYAQSYYDYQHGCGEYFPITSRRELLQIVQTPLTLFFVDEDKLNRQRIRSNQDNNNNMNSAIYKNDKQVRIVYDTTKKAYVQVQANNLTSNNNGAQNMENNSSLQLEELNTDVIYAIAVCEWKSAILEPNKAHFITLPLQCITNTNSDGIIKGAFVKIRLLALGSVKEKTIQNAPSVINSLNVATTITTSTTTTENAHAEESQVVSASAKSTLEMHSRLQSPQNVLHEDSKKSKVLEYEQEEREKTPKQQQQQQQKNRYKPFVLEEELLRLELDRLRNSTTETVERITNLEHY